MPKFKARISPKGTLRLVGIFLILVAFGILIYYFFFSKRDFIEKFETNNWLDGIDAIYWINLDRSIDRKEWMERLFQDPIFQNVPNKRIDAVDGKKSGIIESMLIKDRMSNASDAEYGCLLSHLKAINEFSKSAFKNIIIFEDDMTLDLKPYWKTDMKQIIDGAPDDWDIIQLYYHSVDNTHKFLDEVYTKNLADGTLSGTGAYIINKAAAKKLMDKIYENGKYSLSDEYHHSSDIYLYEELTSYVYKYPIFIYKTDNDSTIHGGHLNGHELNKDSIIEVYDKMV